jgi:hypothetical protein
LAFKEDVHMKLSPGHRVYVNQLRKYGRITRVDENAVNIRLDSQLGPGAPHKIEPSHLAIKKGVSGKIEISVGSEGPELFYREPT